MTEPKRLENLVVNEGVRVLNPAYTKLVRWLRLLLPMGAVVIVVMLFSWVLFDKDNVVSDKSGEAGMDQARNELVEARFESRDSSGRPYTITALKAVQGKRELGQDEKMIYLDTPTGTMTLEDGRIIEVKSKEGTYHQTKEELGLNGGITLTSTDGYALKTKTIFVSMKDGIAKSNTPLQGLGPSGSVEARGFEANNETGHFILKGPAKLVIKPEAL